MRKNTVKLRLSRETLNRLDLRTARGGEPDPPIPDPTDSCPIGTNVSCVTSCNHTCWCY